MIQLPRRSVTRFFIPLIDVLILLFCIFLLMPLIGPAGEPGLADETRARSVAREDRAADESMPGEPALPDASEPAHERLYIRVLEIDADSGKLFSQEGDRRIEINSAAVAEGLIARHRQEAGARELYYLLLYPRRLTGYPEEGQVRQYRSWLQGVAFGTDNPRAPR
jgi:hypothetical protein